MGGSPGFVWLCRYQGVSVGLFSPGRNAFDNKDSGTRLCLLSAGAALGPAFPSRLLSELCHSWCSGRPLPWTGDVLGPGSASSGHGHWAEHPLAAGDRQVSGSLKATSLCLLAGVKNKNSFG